MRRTEEEEGHSPRMCDPATQRDAYPSSPLGWMETRLRSRESGGCSLNTLAGKASCWDGPMLGTRASLARPAEKHDGAQQQAHQRLSEPHEVSVATNIRRCAL